MPIDNDHPGAGSHDFLPKMVAFFRPLLLTKEMARKRDKHAESAQKIIAWVDSAEQQQIELERKKIRDELIKDGGATPLHNINHNNSQSIQ